MRPQLHIQPSLTSIAASARAQPGGVLFDHPLQQWREKTRLELGLATDRPIIATGHQTLLWHPGILAKYMVMDVVADAHGLARANLIVDQHVDDYGEFAVPIRRGDDSLAVRNIELTPVLKDVPMGRQRPFAAPAPPALPYALNCVRDGVQRIVDAVNAHRDAPSAAMQMAQALSDLMSRWVRPVTHVTATDLGQTTLGRTLLRAMADDPHAMARAYNDAVAAVPEAGIGPLLVRDDYVELPLWRIRPDGRRMRAYDNDAQAALDDPSLPPLLPRALFMTALVRLGMCDMFIHGTGGAIYDTAMERWMHAWLGVQVAPIAVATATLRLPLLEQTTDQPAQVEAARHAARHVWHDPAARGERSPSTAKQEMLAQINAQPRRSAQRKAAFYAMHRQLEASRSEHAQSVRRALDAAEAARRNAENAAIAQRRDWPFALYPPAMLDELAAEIAGEARVVQ